MENYTATSKLFLRPMAGPDGIDSIFIKWLPVSVVFFVSILNPKNIASLDEILSDPFLTLYLRFLERFFKPLHINADPHLGSYSNFT